MKTHHRTMSCAVVAHLETLDVLDVATNLQLTQGIIDEFVKGHHVVVSKVTYYKSPS